MKRLLYLAALAALAIGLAVPGLAGAQDEPPAEPELFPPTAAFTATPTAGNAPLTVTFQDGSQPGLLAAPIESWQWDFGDGATFVGQNPPAHEYAQAGTYTVTLTVADGLGASDAETKTNFIHVNGPPSAGFTSSQAADSLAVQFTDASTALDGSETYAWDFGDGATSADPSPTHTFTSAGPHTVTLTVTDAAGLVGTHSETITLNVAPTAGFTWEQAADSLAVEFADGSADSDGTIDAYSWDFGDGATSEEASPTHPFTSAGPHEVTLTVTDDRGGTDTHSETITLNEPPAITDFTASQAVDSLGVKFTPVADDPDGSTLTYDWDFGPGEGTSTEAEPTHPFNSPGQHDVKLTVTDDDGGTDTLTKTITVNPLPDFTSRQDARSMRVTFEETPASLDIVGDRVWTIDETPAGSEHTFTEPGPHEVKLSVTHPGDTTTEVTRTVHVNAIPGAGFTWVADPSTREVRFTPAVTDDGTIESYEWDFGDGGSSDQAAPAHTFATPGEHDVTLTVTDDDGGIAERTETVTVNARPTASFDVSALSGPAPFEPAFTSAASDADGSIVSQRWDFGDGTTASGATAAHRYDSVGTYDVRLTVTDDDGATATATRTVAVTLPAEVIDDSPAAPTLQKVLTDLLERTPGPCSVRMLAVSALVVCGGNKPSALGLRIWAVNAAPSPVAATITGVEAVPRTRRARRAAKPKPARYRARRGTIPASGSAAFGLDPPARLRRALKARIARRGRVARKPVVTMRAGGFTAVAPHIVTARGKKKRR
jgi:PKD repeat protein